MMTTLTVTAKGQVTLRKDVLEHLGVSPGQRIEVLKLPDGRIEVRAAARGDIAQVFGMLDNNGVHLTLDDIDAAIAAGWATDR
jgi:AbrB family looped-hinge helix DNA binding protein